MSWSKVASFCALVGLSVFVFPYCLVDFSGSYGLLGVALAYQCGMVFQSLYVMVCVRKYPWKEPFSFFVQRLSECLQYSMAVSFWLAWVHPLETGASEVIGRDSIVEGLLAAVWQRGLPMWLGCNFSLLDREPFKGISFTAEGWRVSPAKNVAVVVGLAIAAGAQAWIASDKAVPAWLVVLVLVTLAQEVARMAVAKAGSVHIHHYYVGGAIGLLCWNSHPYTLFLSHLMWGVYVEGVAAWGRDPTFGASS